MRKIIITLLLVFIMSIPVLSYALSVGDIAPGFEARSTHGTVILSEFAGKKNVVLAFYYADFTPVWTDEMQSFQRDLEKFEGLNTQVLGISADSVETHLKFSKEYAIAFPLISDEDMQIKKNYGMNRITYLIDKQGVIRFIQTGVPDNKEFLKEIRKLSEKYESHKKSSE